MTRRIYRMVRVYRADHRPSVTYTSSGLTFGEAMDLAERYMDVGYADEVRIEPDGPRWLRTPDDLWPEYRRA